MLFLHKGNRIINGDFESGEVGCPPDDWTSDNVLIVCDEKAFTGAQAALLGADDPYKPALLFQDIEVCPMHRYQLVFQLGGFDCSHGPVIAQVRWLDALGADLGTGLFVFIDGRCTPNICHGFWDAHVHITDFAPLRARSARMLFTRGAGKSSACPTVLDAVALFDIC